LSPNELNMRVHKISSKNKPTITEDSTKVGCISYVTI
jgi:hypothetical protein